MSPHDTVGPQVQFALTAVKTVILLLGGVVTYLAHKAYRRTSDRSLLALSVGFGLITVGVLLAGFTFEVLGVALGLGILIESLFVLAGFVVITYSLRVR